ncbi:MAG: hypothetical protein KBD73_02510 [Candidatus Magasanikbacteria bacterium]|nr:hypothetical protein [Candidatus Magasanikbacteria bacterium]
MDSRLQMMKVSFVMAIFIFSGMCLGASIKPKLIGLIGSTARYEPQPSPDPVVLAFPRLSTITIAKNDAKPSVKKASAKKRPRKSAKKLVRRTPKGVGATTTSTQAVELTFADAS